MGGTIHTVVARFDDPVPAREAMVDLEGKGIENEDALETYEVDPGDPGGVAVEVRVDDPGMAAQAVAVLRSHNPRQLERRAG
jgi:hypothetical protein